MRSIKGKRCIRIRIKWCGSERGPLPPRPTGYSVAFTNIFWTAWEIKSVPTFCTNVGLKLAAEEKKKNISKYLLLLKTLTGLLQKTEQKCIASFLCLRLIFCSVRPPYLQEKIRLDVYIMGGSLLNVILSPSKEILVLTFISRKCFVSQIDPQMMWLPWIWIGSSKVPYIRNGSSRTKQRNEPVPRPNCFSTKRKTCERREMCAKKFTMK